MAISKIDPILAHKRHLRKIEKNVQDLADSINKFLEANYIYGFPCEYRIDSEISNEIIRFVISEYKSIGWDVQLNGLVLTFMAKMD